MPTSVSLLAPYGLTVCFLALLPFVVVAIAFRRQRRVAAALRLEPVTARRALRAAALPAAACLMLGVAAAQPVIATTTERSTRTASEVVFVTDVSRSMAAATAPGAPTRLDRARTILAQLRAAVPDVPAGISGLTDRVLPYSFPSLDSQVFAETLARSVQIESPPPQNVSDVATSFEPLSSLGRDGFFDPGTEHRTCVLVTDGETRSEISWNGGCRLVIVRIGAATDRIYGRNGKVDAAFRPESTAASAVEQLARTSGGAAFSEGDVRGAAETLRRLAEAGPSERVGETVSAHALAPFFALLALAAVALEFVRRYLRPAGGVILVRRRRNGAAEGVEGGMVQW